MPLKAAYKAYDVDQTRRFYQKRRLLTVNIVYETARPSGHGLQISNQNIKCAIDFWRLVKSERSAYRDDVPKPKC